MLPDPPETVLVNCAADAPSRSPSLATNRPDVSIYTVRSGWIEPGYGSLNTVERPGTRNCSPATPPSQCSVVTLGSGRHPRPSLYSLLGSGRRGEQVRNSRRAATPTQVVARLPDPQISPPDLRRDLYSNTQRGRTVETRTWGKWPFQFAHFTDRQLADALQALANAPHPGRRAGLIADIYRERCTSSPDILAVKWRGRGRISELDLADVTGHCLNDESNEPSRTAQRTADHASSDQGLRDGRHVAPLKHDLATSLITPAISYLTASDASNIPCRLLQHSSSPAEQRMHLR
jgi:hypothetical protein